MTVAAGRADCESGGGQPSPLVTFGLNIGVLEYGLGSLDAVAKYAQQVTAWRIRINVPALDHEDEAA